MKNAIIFCNRKRDVATLHRSLLRHGFSVLALHGDMDQPARTAALEQFRKGDVADTMFYTVSGAFQLVESGLEVPPNRLVGELGLIAPDNRRTQTLVCTAAGDGTRSSTR